MPASIRSAFSQKFFTFRLLFLVLAGMLLLGLGSEGKAGPYQLVGTSSGECPLPQALCEFDFPPIPAGFLFKVEHTSCGYLSLSTTAHVLDAGFHVVTGNDQQVFTEHVHVHTQGVAGIGTFFVSNQPTVLFVRGGFKLRAFVSLTPISSISFDCKVSGDLLRL